MAILVHSEINLSRIVREDIVKTEDLATLALDALDQCAFRFYKAGNTEAAKVVTEARSKLTLTIQRLWK